MPIKAVIFDGGGTIWDSMRVLYDSYVWAFERAGLCKKENFPYTMEECNMLSSLRDFNTEHGKARGFLAVFLSGADMRELLSKEDPNTELIKLVKKVREQVDNFDGLAEKLGDMLTAYLYEIFDDSKYPLCKNVREALQELKKESYAIGLVSNRRKRSTLNILEAHEIVDFFDCIIALEDQTKPKPHPEGVLKAMEQLSISKDECVFVGDSEVDILAGRAAGVFCVGVLTGMADERILKRAGADVVIEDLSALKYVLKNIDHNPLKSNS